MVLIYAITGIAVIASLIADHGKTIKSFRVQCKNSFTLKSLLINKLIFRN